MNIKSEDIVQTKPQNKVVANYKTIVYTIKGEEDYIDDEGNPIVADRHYTRDSKEYCEAASSQPQALAKLSEGRVQQYFIKIEKTGLFVNPLDIYNNKEVGRVIQYRTESQRKFVPVNQKCFNLYLKFLRTGLQKYLLQAQRET